MRTLVQREQATRMAAVTKALGDPVRLQLVDVLRRHAGKVCVCELVPLFEVSGWLGVRYNPRMLLSRAIGVGRALVVAAVGAVAVGGGAFAAGVTSQTGTDTWSALTPIGSSLRLAAVSCPTSNFCAIASESDSKSDEGTIYTSSGANLSKPTVISKYDGSPDSVSCPTSSFCVAIDNAGSVYSFNGTGWSEPQEIDAIPPANQTAVSCASSSFCAAIDDSGDVEMFDGTNWTKSSKIDPGGGGYASEDCTSNQEGTCSAPAAIACPLSNLCVAVDGTGSVFAFNGSGWSAPSDIDGTTAIVSLSCAPGTSFCVAVDATGNALAFNGKSWGAPTQFDVAAPESVSCPSVGFCLAVDFAGNVMSLDGTAWSAPLALSKSGLSAISCGSRSFCVAATPKSSVLSFGTASAFPQAPITLRVKTAKVGASGAFSLPVSCPSGVRGCSGTFAVTVTSGRITVSVASTAVKLSAGRRGTLKLKVSKAHFFELGDIVGHRFGVTATFDGVPVTAKLTLFLSHAND